MRDVTKFIATPPENEHLASKNCQKILKDRVQSSLFFHISHSDRYMFGNAKAVCSFHPCKTVCPQSGTISTLFLSTLPYWQTIHLPKIVSVFESDDSRMAPDRGNLQNVRKHIDQMPRFLPGYPSLAHFGVSSVAKMHCTVMWQTLILYLSTKRSQTPQIVNLWSHLRIASTIHLVSSVEIWLCQPLLSSL